MATSFEASEQHNQNNSGQVHPDHPPIWKAHGLRFRSRPEIRLFEALRESGLTVLPLPVVVRGRSRLEPDFLVLHRGRLFVIEVDGAAYHAESAEEAERRLDPLTREGAIVRRVRARDCGTTERARRCAEELTTWMDGVVATERSTP